MQFRIPVAQVVTSITLVVTLSACGGGETSTPTPSSSISTNRAESNMAPPSPSTTFESMTTDGHASTASVHPTKTVIDGAHESVTPFLYPTPGGAAIFDENHDGGLTWDEYELAIAQAIEAFPWPPAYQVTPEVILAPWQQDPANLLALFEIGFELDNVYALWSCAWMQTWLDSRQSGDAALAAQALEYMINTFPQSYQDEYSRDYVRSVGEKARLGDPSGVIQAVKANHCAARLQDMPTPAS